MASNFSLTGLPMRTPEGETFTHDEAARNLAEALEGLPTYVTPATASSLQATENLWRRIEADGLLTSDEVTALLGLDYTSRAIVTGLWRSNQIIGVQRRGRTRYPRSQFDPENSTVSKRVLAVVPGLIAISVANKYSHTDLLFWLFSPTTYFKDGGRPVDHLKDGEELLDVARNSMGVEW